MTDWIAVKRACNRLDKHRQWLDDTDLAGPSVEKMGQPKVVELHLTKQPKQKED